VIDSARDEVADTAPRTYSFRIDPDKIREVIGKGGATIRSICETSGTYVMTVWNAALKTSPNGHLRKPQLRLLELAGQRQATLAGYATSCSIE
jgi:hypothetical protein